MSVGSPSKGMTHMNLLNHVMDHGACIVQHATRAWPPTISYAVDSAMCTSSQALACATLCQDKGAHTIPPTSVVVATMTTTMVAAATTRGMTRVTSKAVAASGGQTAGRQSLRRRPCTMGTGLGAIRRRGVRQRVAGVWH